MLDIRLFSFSGFKIQSQSFYIKKIVIRIKFFFNRLDFRPHFQEPNNCLNLSETFTLNKMLFKILLQNRVWNITLNSVHLMNEDRNTLLHKAAVINFPVCPVPDKKLIPGNAVADFILISPQKIKRVSQIRKLHFTAYVFVSLHLKANLFEYSSFIFRKFVFSH